MRLDPEPCPCCGQMRPVSASKMNERIPSTRHPGWIQHISCEGSHYHVHWYSTQGVHCKEPECEDNWRPGLQPPTKPTTGEKAGTV